MRAVHRIETDAGRRLHPAFHLEGHDGQRAHDYTVRRFVDPVRLRIDMKIEHLATSGRFSPRGATVRTLMSDRTSCRAFYARRQDVEL